MADLELQRVPGERRLYVLEGVGALRLEGLFSRAATAEANGNTWRIGRRGFWQRIMQATDATGTPIGEFEPNSLRRGGTLHWGGRRLTLRSASAWREKYALADDDRELALLDGKSWGQRPVKISVDDLRAIEPGLLLFTAFVVRGLAEDADAAAGAGASAAVSSSS